MPRDEHGNIILPDGTTKPPSKRKNYYTPVAVQRGEVATDPAQVTPSSANAAPTAAGTALDPNLPPAYVDGQPNPERWRYMFRVLTDKCHHAALGLEDFPKGFNPAQIRDVIKDDAKQHGLDPKHLADARTPEEKLLDASERFISAPASHTEWVDEELDAMERAMIAARNGCTDYIRKQMEPDPGGPLPLEDPRPKSSRLARIEAWLARIQKLRKLRDWARNELPTGGDRTDAIAIAGMRASHALRFMIYVGRSSMNQSAKSRPADSVFEIAPHHCKMACDVWEAENGVHYDREGQRIVFEEPLDGCIVICPPGHGKSAFGRHFVALRIFKNNFTQGHIIHAVDQKAEQNLEYVRACFEPDTEDGRRALSLFPIQLADYDNNKSKMRLRLPRKVKQPTLYAAGINAAVSGDDSNLQWWDDPIDQKIMDQPTERERAFDRLNGTWLRRMRGRGHFLLVTATLWHHEDPINRLIELSKPDKNGNAKSYYRVSRQRCGGPKPRPEHGLREWQALWPSQYPGTKLRQIYESMRNPMLYAAQYEGDPKPSDMRIIQKLRFYDPTEKSHERFVAGAVKRLSLDPSATRDEKADMAGAVYLANGQLIEEGFDEHGQPVISERPACRILAAIQMHANQTELVEYGLSFAMTHPTDYVHVEVRSGFQGFAEMFESRGIDPIRHDPKNKSKGERLKAAAPMIEHAGAVHGFHAVVEFPGIRQSDGRGGYTIAPDPTYRWLYEQILDFGVCGQDHCLDALTQVVNYLASELGVGRGAVTTAVQAQRSMAGIDPRKRAMLDQLRRDERRGRTGEEEIDGWLKSTWR